MMSADSEVVRVSLEQLLHHHAPAADLRLILRSVVLEDTLSLDCNLFFMMYLSCISRLPQQV